MAYNSCYRRKVTVKAEKSEFVLFVAVRAEENQFSSVNKLKANVRVTASKSFSRISYSSQLPSKKSVLVV
ncbi:MAG: hypothetical protein KME49_29850 [Brasilonema octagenarum HA4186-MV1]|jgi:hypothetical protein|uniref:hypothetical protein n=1 Tax=Brasilonema TaxID=383614 RepID=UPI00145F6F82|nr:MULTISPECIES: hypothetical protein [Brasilonema]MBW4629603.1 hypothetical protein [Brasilonema octagenarum HA4186-MV1]